MCLWSCGDDDDSTGATGGNAGKGGGGGKGGTSAQGGAGGAKGGTTGSGGAPTAGKGGTAPGTGGTAPGTGGTAPGTGGTAPGTGGKASGGSSGGGGKPNTGGVGPGGSGGMGGEMQGGAGSGNMGGDGGAGGAKPATLADYCASVCSHVPTNCTVNVNTPCVDRCTSYTAEGGGSDNVKVARLHAEYEALINCLANKVIAASGYECRDADDSTAWWSPTANGACESQLCTWTIDDQFNADPAVYDRCCTANPTANGC